MSSFDHKCYTYDPTVDSDTIEEAIEDLTNTDPQTQGRILLHILTDLATPDEWDKVIAALPETQRSALLYQLEYAADAEAERAARVSGYAIMRGGSGSGDHGHDKAMDKANATRKRIRKALGYSYP